MCEEIDWPPIQINVAVIGVGAFGRNHARVYHELEQQGEGVRLSAIVDADVNRADEVASEYGTRSLGSIEQLLTRSEIQAASIAVPTVHHMEVARELLDAGIDVLIEKPLAFSLAEADEIIAAAKKQQRVAQVGHLERFNPAVSGDAAADYAPDVFRSAPAERVYSSIARR